MAHIKLDITKREITGNQCRKLRREGFLPAVVFGVQEDSFLIQISAREFSKLYKESGKTHVIDLTLGDKIIPAIVHSLDVDPIRNIARHVDFREVNLNKKVVAHVPIVFEGEPVGVKTQGGVFVSYIDEIEVEALPDNIPSEIKINVEKIANIGDSMYISDLQKSSKYDIITEENTAMCGLIAQSTEEDFESTSELDLSETEDAGDSAGNKAGTDGKGDKTENKENSK